MAIVKPTKKIGEGLVGRLRGSARCRSGRRRWGGRRLGDDSDDCRGILGGQYI